MTDTTAPTRLFKASPTRLIAWLGCKRQYRFSYLETPRPPKGPAWAHNTVGNVAHEVLAAFYGEWPIERRTPDEVTRAVHEKWRNVGFRDEAQSLEWRDRVTDMVLTYLRSADRGLQPRGIERTVSFKTDRAILSGRVDRIDERPARDGDGEELAIVDYKTGRKPVTIDQVRSSLAMALYVLGARRVLRQRVTRVELHHLPTNTIAAADHDEASLARHLGRAENIADYAAKAEVRWREGLTPTEVDELFPPEPSALCGWCDFARLCPAGRRVAPTRDPWAALEDSGSGPEEYDEY